MTKISLIACIGKNRELGKNNDLIWKIPEDMEYFKRMTLGHPVIMGETTYYSIGKPLAGRTNIILSKNRDLKVSGAIVAHSIKEAIGKAKTDNKEIFFIGGGNVYKQAIKLASKMYLTIVDDRRPADTYFPDYSEFEKSRRVGGGAFRGIEYQFMIFER